MLLNLIFQLRQMIYEGPLIRRLVSYEYNGRKYYQVSHCSLPTSKHTILIEQNHHTNTGMIDMSPQWLRDSFFGQCMRHICKPVWCEYPEESAGWMEAANFHNLSSQNEKSIRVEWYSDTDEENPQSWSQAKKAFVTGVIGAYSFVVYMSAPIYTPGENSFMDEFHVSSAEAALGLAIYV